MFPWVYGFEWTIGHLVFLGIFFAVVLVIVFTLACVATKSILHFRSGRAGSIHWLSLFHNLPRVSRACRHALTGEMPGRACELGFDCRECVTHGKLVARRKPAPIGSECEEVLGMSVPLDRLYHRGHCWVKVLRDGIVLVGLDELGRRLVGRPEALDLPSRGSRVAANSTAFQARKNGTRVRILAPVDGEVIETGRPNDDWILKLRATTPLDTRHLLRGNEVRAWYQREIERLQLLAGETDGAPALADGGELADDLSAILPAERWEAVCGQILMDT